MFGPLYRWITIDTIIPESKDVIYEARNLYTSVFHQHKGEDMDGESSYRTKPSVGDGSNALCYDEHSDGGDDNHSVRIAIKIMTLWKIYKTYRDTMSPLSLFPYYIGVAIDLCIPSFLAQEDSVYSIYKNNNAPEQLTIASINHDEQFDPVLSPRILESLWKCHINHRKALEIAPITIIPSRTHQKKNNRKQSSVKIPKISDMSCVHQPKQHAADMPLNPKLMKLLQKGIPESQCTTRYIIRSLTRALVTDNPVDDVVVRLSRSFFLGSYRHAKNIADPFTRVNIYNETPSHLCERLKVYNPTHTYLILSECIAASMTHHTALMNILKTNLSFKEYYKQALTIPDEYLRTSIKRKKPQIETIFPKEWSHEYIFYEFYNALEIKYTVKREIVEVGTESPGVDMFYNTLDRQQRGDFQLHHDILVDIGMPDADISLLSSSFSDVMTTKTKIPQLIKRIIDGMSLKGKCKLHLYLHFVVSKNIIRLFKTHKNISRRHWTKSQPFLVVCERCHTIREKYPGTQKKKKAKKTRLSIDLEKRTIICSSCNTDDQIVTIDMKSHYVHGPKRKSKGFVTCAYSCCRMCGIVVECGLTIGQDEYCQSCYYNAASLLTIKTCFCGAMVTSSKKNKQNSRTKILVDESGKYSVYGLCSAHEWVTSHFDPHTATPLASYKALVGTSVPRKKTKSARKSKRSLVSLIKTPCI